MNSKIENKQLMLEETLYATCNGYIGIRANFEEGYPDSYDSIRGTYINGFYENYKIVYGESAFGFPKQGQKIVNVFDGQGIRITIDGDRFSCFDGGLKEITRGLDTEKGYAFRHVRWTSPKGHRLVITFKRMASFVHPELGMIVAQITSLNYKGFIEVASSVKGEVSNYASEHDPRVSDDHGQMLMVTSFETPLDKVVVKGKTISANNEITLAVGHKPAVFSEKFGMHSEGTMTYSVDVNETITFEKYMVFTDSIRHELPEDTAIELLDKAMVMGVEQLFVEQEKYLKDFWKHSLASIKGDDKVNEAIRYSLYQLLASAGTAKGAQIAAKGLTGEGYEGHYFWDTEIYMLPFFTLTQPHIAKALLSYRYEKLGGAIARAKEMGHKSGAKIPWRTIVGSECSAYFPAGSAQYHINADLAYAIVQYWLTTGDGEFILTMGLELLIETARLWLDIGGFDRLGRFVINDVTGPDEYTAIVNNNYYTNAMAKYHLLWTVKLCHFFEKDFSEQYEKVSHKVGLKSNELTRMEQAGAAMYLPFDEFLGICEQDDSFLNKKVWDFEHTASDQYPLLLHFHPLTIYRHQVLKQADTVLAHFLLDDVPLDTMKKSYDYYEKVTTHDSSLSPCVYGMMASRIGDVNKAYQYFMKTVRLDLDNLHHNTKDGLHIANAGGVYLGIVYGFGGLRIKEDGIHLRPRKPKKWQEIAFVIGYKGKPIHVTLGKTIKISVEDDVVLTIYNKKYVVKEGLEVAYD